MVLKLSGLAFLALAPCGLAAPQDGSPLERRAEETAALFAADPQWSEDHFSASFLELVPPARMREILTGVHAEYG